MFVARNPILKFVGNSKNAYLYKMLCAEPK